MLALAAFMAPLHLQLRRKHAIALELLLPLGTFSYYKQHIAARDTPQLLNLWYT